MTDWAALSDPELVAQLHALAGQIYQAKTAGDVETVRSLAKTFYAAAAEYQKRDQESSIVALINSVHDAVLATIGEAANFAAETTGNVLAAVTHPLIGLLLILGAGATALYFLDHGKTLRKLFGKLVP